MRVKALTSTHGQTLPSQPPHRFPRSKRPILCRAAMMYLIQSLVIFAVMASNIHWHWTPNGYLAGILGWIAALLLTVGLNGLGDLLRRWRLSRLADKRGAGQGFR